MKKSTQPPIRLPEPDPHTGPLAQQSDAYLRQLLLEGGLDPGQAVPIDAVAQRLGVSAQPVKAAMRRLGNEGFLVVRAQSGSRVVIPAAADVSDFYGLFGPSEAYIGGLAARRRTNLDAKAFVTLAADIERRARNAGPPGARDPVYRRLNREFHDALHAMAQSPYVGRIVATMWDKSDFYIRVAFGSLFFDDATHAAHRHIAETVAAADAMACNRAIRRHLARVGRSVIARFEDDGS